MVKQIKNSKDQNIAIKKKTCQICKIVLGKNDELDEHLIKMHSSISPDKYEFHCKECDKKFKFKT